MWTVSVGTIFPEVFPGTLGISCIGKNKGILWDLEVSDLRDFAYDKHKKVDDEPFGGGGGMLMKCEPIDAWLSQAQNIYRKKIYVSPRGKVFSIEVMNELVQQDLCILCGRYEGVDQRVLDHWDIEEISVGDFILHGGEVASMLIIEACVRSIEGIIKKHSFENDSFEKNLLEFNQYTRPSRWLPLNEKKVYDVPEVLLSGNHGKISEWRIQNSIETTKRVRPDLLQDVSKANNANSRKRFKEEQ
jgi:tRNA (guanine37-N1)-methyltransferase